VLIIQKPNSKDTEHRVYSDPTTYSSKKIGIDNIFRSSETLLARLLASELTLGDVCFITVGMVLNADETIANGEFIKDDLISETKDEIHIKPYTEGKWIDKYEINAIKYLEWGTNRVPQKIRRATFPELYAKNKLLVNKLGSIKATYDDSNIYCDQTIRLLVKYIDLQGINNNSINNSIKKFSQKSRGELESLSKKYDLKFILGLLNTSLYQYLLEVLRTSESIDINPQILRKLPMPVISSVAQIPFITLVDAILDSKRINPQSDTKEMEERLENLTHEVFNLTEEEMAVLRRG